jgi:hypothetical protein
MVPFSFQQTLLKSRVMQKYLTGVLDDGINGFEDKGVQHHADLESGAFALSCLLAFLIVISDARPGFLSSLCVSVSVWPIRLRVRSWLRIVRSMMSIIDRHAGHTGRPGLKVNQASKSQ